VGEMQRQMWWPRRFTCILPGHNVDP
jgi:hypothetical protein